jgi:hypothetical protein
MDGVTRTAFADLLTVTDQAWTIVGVGDFNNDGKSDILLRNTTNGRNVVWFMDGVTRTAFADLNIETDQNWKIVGTGDFNDDINFDILWRNTTNGLDRVWYMKGVTLMGTSNLQTTVSDLSWKFVGN